jgi:uncharacterized protein
VIAVDSGFLYALADAGDAWHAAARGQAHTLDEGWVTTWPVVAEACHLLGRRLGARFVAPLLDDVAAGVVQVWDIPSARIGEIAPLMRRYIDLPMDLADATLLLLAEHLGHGRILSTDQRDFHAYRWKSRKPFHNLLEPVP